MSPNPDRDSSTSTPQNHNFLWPLVAAAFDPDHIEVQHSVVRRSTNAEVEEAIGLRWQQLTLDSVRRGSVIFDSEIYRLITYLDMETRLRVTLGKTTYRELMGTNMGNLGLVLTYGPGYLSNALGLFGTVLSSDGQIILGKRSERYASLIGRMHLPGGSMSCTEFPFATSTDLFTAYHAELHEELGLIADQIESTVCVGLYENGIARAPHLHFVTFAIPSARDLMVQHARLGDGEFAELVAVDVSSISPFLDGLPPITHAARGALLHARHHIQMALSHLGK